MSTKQPAASRPIATCIAENCTGCPIKGAVHCHFSLKDLAHFVLVAVPSFLLGAEGISRLGEWYLVPWLAFIIAFFGLIEIRVVCTHCPHYAEPGPTLRCWANYGSPKLWKFRPGLMSRAEKIVMLSGFAVIWGYPLIVLLLGGDWLLLALFALTSLGFYVTLRRFLCTQCMNFACPFNSVGEKTREAFFERNPQIARALEQN